MAQETKRPEQPVRRPVRRPRPEDPAGRPAQDRPGDPSSQPLPRRTLTPQEREERERRMALRRREEEERRREEEEERRLRASRSRRALLIVSLVLALVFTAAYWIIVAVSISGRPAVSGEIYPLLVYTEGNQKEDLSYKAEDVVFRGKTCLPLSCPQHYVPMTLSGTAATRTILLENGEEAKFYLNTDRAVVNGQNVFLSGVSFLKDGELYIPVDFFEDKMNCFSYSYSSAQKCYVLTFNGEVTPAFTFHPAPGSLPVDAATVPAPPPQPEPET